MMESKQILNALGQVDEKYIEEAECAAKTVAVRDAKMEENGQAGTLSEKVSRKFRRGQSGGYGRAALILVSVGVLLLGVFALGRTFGLPFGEGHMGSYGQETQTADHGESTVGITIPPLEITLPKAGEEMDMIGFFIYQGRCYVQYMVEESEIGDLVGEYVDTVTGSIDEWSSADEYVELSGSVRGDIYTVKGMAPEFMLCICRNEGVELYVNDNGLTLVKGADLYEDRLHLTGNYGLVEYETRDSWYYSRGQIYTIGEDDEAVVEDFVRALNQGDFMWSRDIPLGEGQTSIYGDKEIYHLYFRMESGMTVHLRLLDGGYVIFKGIHDACVQVDGEIFARLTDVLAAGIENP